MLPVKEVSLDETPEDHRYRWRRELEPRRRVHETRPLRCPQVFSVLAIPSTFSVFLLSFLHKIEKVTQLKGWFLYVNVDFYFVTFFLFYNRWKRRTEMSYK